MNRMQSYQISQLKKRKIRITFLIHSKAFWPSWKSFYESCKKDDSVLVKVFYLPVKQQSEGYSGQFEGTEEFLKENNIAFQRINFNDILGEEEDYIIFQTPYDQWHRDLESSSQKAYFAGKKIVYISYGLEFTESKEDIRNQFTSEFYKTCYKIFSYNPLISLDYIRWGKLKPEVVEAVGHPKFDFLYEASNKKKLPVSFEEKRTILVWHPHFPCLYSLSSSGVKQPSTFSWEQNEELLEFLLESDKFNVIFMPHHMFFGVWKYGFGIDEQKIKNFKKKIFESTNIKLWFGEYPEIISNCDVFIGERSAVTIEIAAFPKTPACLLIGKVEEDYNLIGFDIFSSYTKAKNVREVIEFLLNLDSSRDKQLELRKKVFLKYFLPYWDGKNGERIKNNLILSKIEEIKKEESLKGLIMKDDKIKKYDKIISIGPDCLTAMTLKEIGVRDFSSPFDWVYRNTSSNFYLEEILRLFETNFEDFFRKEILVDEGPIEGHCRKIVNKKTGFVFIHDIPNDSNLDISYDEIYEKYFRRIERLNKILMSAQKVLFVYMDNQQTPEFIYERFVNFIEKKFSNPHVNLLVLRHLPELGEFEINEDEATRITVVEYNNDPKYATRTWDRWYRNEKIYKDLFYKYCLLSKNKGGFSNGKELITVLLPTYNSEAYLRQCIVSILNQTYQNFEILVIDDSTTEGTKRLLSRFDDDRIKIVKGPGRGLAAALNLGLSLSKGDYIARIDADDEALPTRLEKQIEFLNQHSEVGILGTQQEHFGLWSFFHKCEPEPASLKLALLFGCDICHSTVMFRKSFIEQYSIRYPENSPQEDYELWLQCLDKTTIANIPEVLGRYRIHNSITIKKEKILEDYEVSLSSKYIKKFFDISIDNETKEVINRRKKNNKLTIFERVKEQYIFYTLLNRMEKANEKVNFLSNEQFSKAKVKLWNKFYGNRVDLFNVNKLTLKDYLKIILKRILKK